MSRSGDHQPFTITDADVATWIGDAFVSEVTDVRVTGGSVAAIGTDIAQAGDRRVAAAGAALFPGLHDHHLHLWSMAAARTSIDLGDAADPEGFDRSITAALRAGDDPQRWLRVIGFDDRHGPLDRHRLDRLAAQASAFDRPIRVQHRSGAAWVLSSRALEATDFATEAPDGWIHRADDDLATRWPLDDAADLAPVGARLAALGITGVTDATPTSTPSALRALAEARRRGRLPQRVMAMGGPRLGDATFPDGLERGPIKLVISDHALPSIGDLVAAFAAARRAGRPVAVHGVTRVASVLALTAWGEVGAAPGDRIEHGSVLPVEILATIAELGLTVVTQPAFVHARGDDYLASVDLDDQPHLYRCGSLLAAGVHVGGSTDAPFGPDDPWLAMATMVDRTTASGQALGAGEAVRPGEALARFLSSLANPGGPPRTIEIGVPADLLLADRPMVEVLRDLGAVGVQATWVGGHPVHGDLSC